MAGVQSLLSRGRQPQRARRACCFKSKPVPTTSRCDGCRWSRCSHCCCVSSVGAAAGSVLAALLLAVLLLIGLRWWLGGRELMVVNSCPEPVWVGALGAAGCGSPDGGGWRLGPGGASSAVVLRGSLVAAATSLFSGAGSGEGGVGWVLTGATGWNGRLWGRTGCSFGVQAGGSGGSCDTGDCGGKEACGGVGGTSPVTLAEFQLGAAVGGALALSFVHHRRANPLLASHRRHCIIGLPQQECRWTFTTSP